MAASWTCVVKERIQCGLLEIIQKLNTRHLQYHEADYLYYKLDRLETILSQYAQLANIDDRVFCCISEVKYLIRNEIQRNEGNGDGFQCEMVFSGDRGRPRYNITEEQLEYFLDFGFTATEISAMLGVSEPTVRRRLQEFGLSSRNLTNISDDALDRIVRQIKEDFQQSGYRVIRGILRARGYHIAERRIMECLRRVDLEGVILRSLQLQIVHRREYKVYGPNALWHIDTNHKLIRQVLKKSPGGCSLEFLVKGVPPGSPNPNPTRISEPKNVSFGFYTRFQTWPLKSIAFFSADIMSSVLNLEQQHKDFLQSIFTYSNLQSFFLSHFELKQQRHSYMPLVPFEPLPDSRPK